MRLRTVLAHAAALILVGGLSVSSATARDTPARQAILIDVETGSVLFSKNADQRMPPASMSKLMTAYMVFERLADGRLSLDDEFPVSERAWRKGGSKMFVEVGKRVRVEDLLRGIIVQSGNDACIVVAEGLSGSEEAFAEEMTKKAWEIGLTDSNFRNASGWPDPDHYMSARDLARLAVRLARDFPQFYPIYSEKEFTFSGIKQGNRNPLLYKNIGADGLKTGHTEESGYGLTASAVRDGRRLVLVVNGLESVTQRARESERLLQWGFREFKNYPLFKAGETVAEADVWLGKNGSVPLLLEAPLTLTLSRKDRQEMNVTVNYDGPIPAPVARGARIATLRIAAPGLEAPVERPLIAGADIDQLGFVGRIGAALQHLLLGAASR